MWPFALDRNPNGLGRLNVAGGPRGAYDNCHGATSVPGTPVAHMPGAEFDLKRGHYQATVTRVWATTRNDRTVRNRSPPNSPVPDFARAVGQVLRRMHDLAGQGVSRLTLPLTA